VKEERMRESLYRGRRGKKERGGRKERE